MSVPHNVACRMTANGRWSQETHFWGLESSAASVVLNRKAFDCCGGDGLIVDPSNPKNAKLCGLTRRWNLYTRVISQWAELGQSEDFTCFGRPLSGASKDDRAIWTSSVSCLEGFFRGELDQLLRSDKGRVVSVTELRTRLKAALGARETASTVDAICGKLAWLVSAVLTWHFEVCVLPYRMAGVRTARSDQGVGVIPPPTMLWRDAIDKNKKVRKIMIIDGVSEMWNPNRLELFELSVAFASEHKIPVWIFDGDLSAKDVGLENPAGAARTFRGAVNRRLAESRAKPSVEWLSGQGHSRLSEICSLAMPPKQSKIPDIV